MIEKGFFADFVILDQELNLKKVFINGEQVK
jgi:N-acetylglucosamine-6-phosphate deacetylase